MTRIARFGLGLALVVAGCDGADGPSEPPIQPPIDVGLRQSIARWGVIPIGSVPAQDPALVDLGKALFFDKILSGNRDIACASCHRPAAHLTDGLSLAIGTGGTGSGASRTLGPGREFVPRNAPSLLNSGLGQFYLFWDGRLSGHGSGPFQTAIDSVVLSGVPSLLAAQAMLPVLNRREMRGEPGDQDVFGNANERAAFGDRQHGEIWQAIMARLLAIPEYVAMFNAAFPGTPTSQIRFQHAATAIAALQKQAFTKTDSPFDRYLARDDAALTTEQKRGALLFFGDAQCGSCHNGPFLGGQGFANVGAPQLGPGTGTGTPLDFGFGDVIGDFVGSEFYNFSFRVAPLRNVELTAPYMHAGAYATLEAVVRHYSDIALALQEYDASQLPPALRDRVHNDAATIDAVLENLDFRVRTPFEFTESEQLELVAFLKSLTHPSARDLSSIAPASVPSGLPLPE